VRRFLIKFTLKIPTGEKMIRKLGIAATILYVISLFIVVARFPELLISVFVFGLAILAVFNWQGLVGWAKNKMVNPFLWRVSRSEGDAWYSQVTGDARALRDLGGQYKNNRFKVTGTTTVHVERRYYTRNVSVVDWLEKKQEIFRVTWTFDPSGEEFVSFETLWASR
jgi:hypothetical protein